jgi:hypothetical protein
MPLLYILLSDTIHSYICVFPITAQPFQCVWEPAVRPQVNPHLSGSAIGDFNAFGLQSVALPLRTVRPRSSGTDCTGRCDHSVPRHRRVDVG